MTCELSTSPFFQTLLKHFKDVYRQASQKGFLICVPVLNNPVKFDRNFILIHVLKPSPLLKQHFVPCAKSDIVDIEIENNFLVLSFGKSNVKQEIPILCEEIAYTENNRKVTIFIIQRPLIRPKSLEKRLHANTQPNRVEDSITIETFADAVEYLKQKSPKTAQEMYLRSTKLMETYLILPNYLDDAAQRFKSIADWGVNKITHVISTDEADCDNLFVATESFVIAINHEAIFKQVQSRFAKEDELLLKKLTLMDKRNISMKELGSQSCFHSFKVSDDLKLQFETIQGKRTPLEKVHCFKRIFDMINQSLSNLVDKKSNPLEKHPEQVLVLSDDILSATIFCLVKFKPPKMVSHLNYINIFSWKLPTKNEFGYSLVTVEAAIKYILSSECDELCGYSTVKKEVLADSTCYEKNHFDQGSSGVKASRIDDELDRLTKMIKQSQITQSADQSSIIEDSAVLKKEVTSNEDEMKLGSFLFSLKKRKFIVNSGKQT